MKLAIIGTNDAVLLIQRIMKKYFSDIETYSFTLDKVKNIKHVIQKIPMNIDGVFVSGIGVYFELQKYDLKVPVSYAEHGAISLIKCFEKMKKDGCFKKTIHLSFDIMNEEIIDGIIQEFAFPLGDYYLETIRPEHDEEYYITKHLKLFYEKKIDYVITSFGYIYSLFQSLDLPVYRLFPSIFDLKNNINDLIAEVKLSQLDKSKILVYKFKLSADMKGEREKNRFVEFAKSIDALIQFTDDQHVVFISNKNYYNIHFVMDLFFQFMENQHLNHIRVGIGSDLSVQKALKYADMALNKKSSAKIISFDGLLYHEYNESKKMKPVNELSTDRIIEISEETGIIPKRIQKLNEAMICQNKNIFSSNEISQIMGLSVRSANRILNALIKCGYGKLEDNKTINGIGRPKRNVNINLFEKFDRQ